MKPQKILYFDVDGTLLSENRAKPCLADGRFEAAVRRAGFERLVCVGNFCRIAHLAKSILKDYDELEVLMQICRGVFSDLEWFRSTTTLVADPDNRAGLIDLSLDWWYVDDLAVEYLQAAHREDLLAPDRGDRILVPDPEGDGRDVLHWLGKIASHE